MMPVKHTNRYGKTYYLCVQEVDGKTHYFFSWKTKYRRAAKMPKGYSIYEDEHGVVTLRRARQDKQEKSVPCPQCGQKVNQSRLQAHLRKAHGRTPARSKSYEETASGEYAVKCYKCGHMFAISELIKPK
jgi:uncharacterized C2H2 Zn-finger protein/YHS domain-containing protein